MTAGGEEPRRGRQTPTDALVLPYTDSLGAEAVALYSRSKQEALEWQERLVEDIMAVNADGLWTHMKFGWSIPRRNGKSEVLIMRTLWDLHHNRRTLYTAHRGSTSDNAWEKVCRILKKSGYLEDEDYKTYKSAGRRSIEWLLDGSEAVVNFRTRTSFGGLGEGYDTLIIDEAQEYTSDQETALKYVVTDSQNPQTLLCGTPPTAVSSGDVFLRYRKRCMEGTEQDAGWAEWGVPALTDAYNVDLWYETNPSLGAFLTERKIRSELGDDQVDDNIQRLGLWLRYSQKSAISEKEWMRCKTDHRPEPARPLRIFYGVKYAQKTGNVSLAAALRTDDGRIFIEALDCRSVRDGNSWLIAYLNAPSAELAVIDGAAGALLIAEMEDAGVRCQALCPKTAEVIFANNLFEKQLFDGKILHAGQPSLRQAATNCDHRAIGTNGGFGYTSVLEGADVSLLEAVSLAHWACSAAEEETEQFVGY